MKKIIKISIFSIITILMIGGFAKSAFAVVQIVPLSVTFSPNPLFKEANIAPGNKVTGIVGVSNNSGKSQKIIVEATNALDTGGLGDKLNLVIKEGDVTSYTGTLGAFLRDGEVPLSSLENGANTTYSFGVTFDTGADNNLQNKTLGFDLCVGFQGGDIHCGDTVINGGGAVLGSVGVPMTLVISDEQAVNVLNIDQSGSATITWATNKLSTSQVIYGISPGPYNLDLKILPNLGYPSGSIEDPNKVMNHSVTLSGLIPGETYVYRVVSHASPATVSYEHQFTVPILAQKTNNPILNNENVNNPNGNQIAQTPNPLPEDSNIQGVNNNAGLGNLLAASAGNIMGIPSIWFWFAVILLLALTTFLIIYRRRKNK